MVYSSLKDQLDTISRDPDFLQNIWFSDECSFYVSGEVNHHNFRYWSPEKPDFYAEKPLHSEKTHVWAAISKFGILGRCFYQGNMEAQSYLMILQEFNSGLKRKFPMLADKAILQQVLYYFRFFNL